jgi:3-hydroxyacyl-[acyl-carrier-protein] dehydratase
MNIQEILKCLPHRYPFLMVDKVTDIKKGEAITASKMCSFNEPHFQGHFPNNPIMPGVLIIESMAQASGILISQELKEKQLCVLAAVTDVKFKNVVEPGDELQVHCNLKFGKMGVWKLEGSAFVDNTSVAEAKLTIALMRIPE